MDIHHRTRTRLKNTCLGRRIYPPPWECSLKKKVGRSPGAPSSDPLLWRSTSTPSFKLALSFDGIGAGATSDQRRLTSLMNPPFMIVAPVDS